MGRRFNIAAVAIAMAVCFSIAALAAPVKQSGANSFAAPDFAFPQTVEKNADAALKKALRSGDGLTALAAAIQLNVSRNQVSADSYGRSIALYDSLARVLPAFCGDLARLIEAKLYTDIYRTRPRVFDSRTLPADNPPGNVLEWNKELLGAKVDALVTKAMEHSADYAALPLSSLGRLVKETADAEKDGMSVADFMMFRAVDMLSAFDGSDKVSGPARIPFGEKVAEKTAATSSKQLTYIDEAIARHSGNQRAEADLSLFRLSQLSGDAYNESLKQYAFKFFDTPYDAAFLTRWASLPPEVIGAKSENEARRMKLDRLDRYVSLFPDARSIVDVRKEAAGLRNVSATVTCPTLAVSGKNIGVKVSSENLYDMDLLLYSLPANLCIDQAYGVKYQDVIASGKPVKTVSVTLSGTTPDRVSGNATLPALAPGFYAVLPAPKDDHTAYMKKRAEERIAWMLVSDITTYNPSRPDKEDRGEVYVVSALNGAPVKGAKVTFTNRYGSSRQVESAITDENGVASTSMKQFRFVAQKGGSYAMSTQYLYTPQKPGTTTTANVLTDLSLYRPGQKLGFVATVFDVDDVSHRVSPCVKTPVDAVLYDRNMQAKDTIPLVTDDFGRCSGSFELPAAGLLGIASIYLYNKDSFIGESHVQVADYKAPTFFVTAESATPSYEAGDEVTVSGKALTYTGMPVAGGKVNYTIGYSPVWWWRGDWSSATYGGSVETDASGAFSIRLPSEALRGTRYAIGRYDLQISVTDPAGETQETTAAFSMGEAYTISASVPAVMALGAGSGKISVRVSDAIGRPAVRKVFYELLRDSLSVARGSFDSPLLQLPLEQLLPATYSIRFSLSEEALAPGYAADDASVQIVTQSFVAYDPDSKTPPAGEQLWVPEGEYVVADGSRDAAVAVGSCYDSYILAEIADGCDVIRREWIRRDNQIAALNMAAPGHDSRTTVTFLSMRDMTPKTASVTVMPAYQKAKLDIETVSFRDRITPGAAESWKFRLSTQGKPCADIPVMAVMSDKALNAIAPFRWNFNPFLQLSWMRPGRISVSNIGERSNTFSRPFPVAKGTSFRFTQPAWEQYGLPLYALNGVWALNEVKVRGGGAANRQTLLGDTSYKEEDMYLSVESAPAMAKAAATEAIAADSVADAGSGGESGGESGDLPAVAPREKEHPLAFFMPDLFTDHDGYVEIPFTAPEFVGTWQFQIAGYNRDMKGAVSVLDAVAAKKVMAQLNAPRFLRTGDRTTFLATLYNNSDSMLHLSGRIVITDPATGREIVSSSVTGAPVAPSASRVISLDFTVPSKLSAIAVAAYGYAEGAADGEQVAVPLLPSSTPVVESTTFYLGKGALTESFKLPSYEGNSRLTLQYCANPVWECVTALPGIARPSSANVLALADALYADALAGGLFAKYPVLVQGIREMSAPENAADSTLVSPLQKNGGLKTVALNNTPWVNSANAETARMQSLLDYADPQNAANAVEAIVTNLDNLRRPDGGWSWCPGYESSEFITEEVLSRLAALHSAGFMPAGVDRWLKPSFRFCDTQLLKAWKETGRKSFSKEGMLDYLYVKSCFKGMEFNNLDRAAMKSVRDDWRDLDIYHKATAAIVLSRRGDKKLAATVLESLRQFASSDKSKGVWYDNLRSGWNGRSRLLTTARVFEAFALLAPADPMVDGLRQWLVLAKQTENWGTCGNLAGVVSSILSAGSDWVSDTQLPEITLGDRPLESSRYAGLTGAFTLSVDAKEASRAKLTISKRGGAPSWGGLVSQYVAPIRDVKAASLPQLSVRKALYTIVPDKDGVDVTGGKIRVGDRVRVTLFVTTDRDMEYVALTDSRAACLEPEAQLSGPRSSDGVYFYQEVRNEATNLFIPFLPKGTHVLSYDCFADREGTYSLGIATAQSQYAPVIVAHSAGNLITVIPATE